MSDATRPSPAPRGVAGFSKKSYHEIESRLQEDHVDAQVVRKVDTTTMMIGYTYVGCLFAYTVLRVLFFLSLAKTPIVYLDYSQTFVKKECFLVLQVLPHNTQQHLTTHVLHVTTTRKTRGTTPASKLEHQKTAQVKDPHQNNTV